MFLLVFFELVQDEKQLVLSGILFIVPMADDLFDSTALWYHTEYIWSVAWGHMETVQTQQPAKISMSRSLLSAFIPGALEKSRK